MVNPILETTNKQPIKKISYKDVHFLYDMLEQLNSWQGALELFDQFFSDKNSPLNKKKIISDYHACSQIFPIFYQDFSQTMKKINTQMVDLSQKEKV